MSETVNSDRSKAPAGPGAEPADALRRGLRRVAPPGLRQLYRRSRRMARSALTRLPIGERGTAQVEGPPPTSGAPTRTPTNGLHVAPLQQTELLPHRLSDLLLQHSLDRPIPPDAVTELRDLAIEHRVGDRFGYSLAALALLAEEFDDPVAASWLPVALADAGRFDAAVELETPFNRGRPGASAYMMLVIALHQSGRAEEAEQRLRRLERKFPSLGSDFVSIWGDTGVASAYRDTVTRLAPDPSQLPVFYHLPFCGGTSQLISFRRSVPWARMLHVTRRYGLMQLLHTRQMPPEIEREMMLVHLHHPFPVRFPNRTPRYFTVLRDPVSQLRSGFYKRQLSEGIVRTRDTASDSFADHVGYLLRHQMTNMLARQLCALHPDLAGQYRREYRNRRAHTALHAEEDMLWFRATRRLSDDRILEMAQECLETQFSVVGTLKHLQASQLASAAATGVPLIKKLPHAGRSGQSREPEADAVVSRLREANWVDQRLFEQYTDRFERDHQHLIDAVRDTTR